MAIRIKTKKTLDRLYIQKELNESLDFYQSARDKFETGDLLFFSGKHWLSSLIRWRSKSSWSHIGMVIHIQELDRYFLVESVLENGVRMLPLSFVFNDYAGNKKPYSGRVAWAKHEAIQQNHTKQQLLKTFCLDNLSKQYDRKEYWRILWRSFVGLKRFFEDDKYTCAEYIYEAYKYADVKLPKEKGFFISPGSFWLPEEVKLQAILI
jgi:Permuted papain-like amidase enzyme, YaeF/YiiX, C92 family